MATKPATHHKSKRTRPYALRDKKGQLKDVQDLQERARAGHQAAMQ